MVGSEEVQGFSTSSPHLTSADTLEVRSTDKDGVIPRAVKFLFKEIEKRTNLRYTVQTTYLEIYNEQVHMLKLASKVILQVRDLVNNTGEVLSVKLDPSRGFYVQNLTHVTCANKREVMRIFSKGNGAHKPPDSCRLQPN
jgi:hypothetical protein